MLLLIALAIPIGERMYASLVIRPETYTLSASHYVLDRLPGVDVEREGPDLSFSTDAGAGTIALGEYSRGAALLVGYVAVGVFVVFSRIRPLWQVIVMAIVAAPVAVFCNFVRFLVWGGTTIYGSCGPLSAVPRAVSIVVSLALAYLLFVVSCAILDNLVVEVEGEDDDEEDELEAAEGA
jgi:hypothetical protein